MDAVWQRFNLPSHHEFRLLEEGESELAESLGILNTTWENLRNLPMISPLFVLLIRGNFLLHLLCSGHCELDVKHFNCPVSKLSIRRFLHFSGLGGCVKLWGAQAVDLMSGFNTSYCKMADTGRFIFTTSLWSPSMRQITLKTKSNPTPELQSHLHGASSLSSELGGCWALDRAGCLAPARALGCKKSQTRRQQQHPPPPPNAGPFLLLRGFGSTSAIQGFSQKKRKKRRAATTATIKTPLYVYI